MEKYRIIEEPIPIQTYRKLRYESGLSGKTEEAARIGLKSSVYSVMVADEAKVIGMGRIIGDGGCFCQVVDICVLPPHRGKGVGKLIMEKISGFINERLPESCYVSLIADGDAAFLYEQFGFKDTMPKSKGMYFKKHSS